MSSTILASCGTILGIYEALDKSAAEQFNRPYSSPPQDFKPPAKKRKAGLIKPLKVKARLFSTPHQTCAIGPKGLGLYCWGSSFYGELGAKDRRISKLIKIKGLPKNDPVVDMVFMNRGACVLLRSGYDNRMGTVGNQKRGFYPKSTYVQALEGAVKLSSYFGAKQVCAILYTGDLPGTPDKWSMNECLSLCDKKDRGKDELYCSLACGTALKYYHGYLDSVKKGQPVVPAIQTSLNKYKFKTLTNSGLGFCGISKSNEVFCWGHNIASRKKNKKLLNIKKISKNWWK